MTGAVNTTNYFSKNFPVDLCGWFFYFLEMLRVKKIIEYGLYLYVFLLPLQTRWIIRQGEISGYQYEFSTLSLYATDILLVLLIAAAALKKLGNKEEKNVSMIWIIAGIELFSFISIFLAQDKMIALQGYLRLLLGIGLLWLIAGLEFNRKKLIDIFILSSLFQAVFGVWQFLVQHSFACSLIGVASHLPQDKGASVVMAENGERWLRAYGGLDHPNIFGGLMAISLVLLVIQSFDYQSKPIRRFYYLGAIILSSGLFFSFSRAAWLAFALSFALTAYNAYKKKILFLNRNMYIASAFPLIILAALYFNLVAVRSTGQTYTEKKSTNDRVELLKISKEVIKDNWMFGVGIGNYGSAVMKEHNNFQYNLYQPVHNTLLLVLSEIGIIGMSLIISLLIYIVWLAQKIGDERYNPVILAIFSLFLFDHWLWSIHFGIIFFWLIIGILYLERGEKKI